MYAYLFTHIYNLHVSEILRYYCPRACGRSYNRRDNVQRHLKFECGVPKQFMCSYCGKYYTYKSILKNHVTVVHGQHVLNSDYLTL